MVKWKVFGRKRSWPHRDTIPAFLSRDLGKAHISFIIARVQASIRTEGLPITSLQLYRWASLLGDEIIFHGNSFSCSYLVIFLQTNTEKIMSSFLEIFYDKSMTTNWSYPWWRRINSSDVRLTIISNEERNVTCHICSALLPTEPPPASGKPIPFHPCKPASWHRRYMPTSAANFMSMWAKFQGLEMGWNNLAGRQRYL
jgi:hypothetical protein